jgi:hypothetical protein
VNLDVKNLLVLMIDSIPLHRTNLLHSLLPPHSVKRLLKKDDGPQIFVSGETTKDLHKIGGPEQGPETLSDSCFVVVLCADITGFTPLSQKKTPKEMCQ